MLLPKVSKCVDFTIIREGSSLTTPLPHVDPISDPSKVSYRLLESDLKVYSLVIMEPEVGERQGVSTPDAGVSLSPPSPFAQRPPSSSQCQPIQGLALF